MVRCQWRWISCPFWIRPMWIKIRILVPSSSRMVRLGHLRNFDFLGICPNYDEIHGQHWPWPFNVPRPIRICLALRCNDSCFCWSCFRSSWREQGWKAHRLVNKNLNLKYNEIAKMTIKGNEYKLWSEFTKRGVEISLPKTGNHAQLFASCGMSDSATKDQVTMYISKLMVQFLVEYEDSNGK